MRSPRRCCGTLSSQQASLLGPQQLLNALPTNLQPGSTLFYYNPQEEDLLLQQAALQQTGQASFISGLSYNSTTGASVTDQEKADLYGNALAYAEQNNVQLGTALTQTQINALTAPMLWYVEQTVPDPDCTATGSDTCPTITALMPQIYLPQNSSALSAGGNIEVGNSLTLNFGNAASGGSVTNTGTITSGGTLTVNTGTLTNEANQVNVGDIWNSVTGGYTNTTGTEVQPGGFMSAANTNLNVQTLDQIGGALQELNDDGTVNQAGTQQVLAQLQQQLGGDFTQTSVSNDLNTSFTAQGGFGAMQIFALVAAVVASIVTYGAASAEIGATLGAGGGTFAAASATAATTAGLGNVALSAAIAGLASSTTSQLIGTGSVNWGSAFESAAVAGITAGLTNGITYNSTSGLGFATGPLAVGGPTVSLAGLAGVQAVGGSLVPQAGTAAASNLPAEALAIGADATISASVQTAIEGGSFLNALKNDAVGDVAAAGAYAIGNAAQNPNSILAQGSVGYDLAHAALGCAAGAAEGTGCAGGAIGGAVSAGLNPVIDANGNIPPAVLAGIETAVGGGIAGALGYNVQGAATAAQNETLNNWAAHVGLSGSVNIPGTGANYAFGFGVLVDGDGNVGLYKNTPSTVLPGLSTGGAGSVGVSVGIYPAASTIQDYAGPFNNVSFGIGDGAYAGADIFQDTSKSPLNPASYGMGFTFGLGVGAGGSATQTNTKVCTIQSGQLICK